MLPTPLTLTPTACSSGFETELDALRVRDVTADDRDAFAEMFARMSPRSRLRRYLSPKPALTSRELDYLTDVDHVRHTAIAAIDADGRMTGVARYAVYAGTDSIADVAVEVVDDWQGRRVGTTLMARVLERACANGLTQLRATTMWENTPSRALLRRMGFRVRDSADGMLELERALPLQLVT